ncbi:MAG: oligosaccharide flippase family protein [Bacteroidota bacterium]|nr:oligosaccharide flippase family protein [Bacteroidota bacterium]
MLSFGASLIARIVQLALGFINIFLISRYLGPQQYGQYSFVVNFVMLFAPAIDLSLNHILTREISQNGIEKIVLIKAVFFLRLILFLLLFPFIITGANAFSGNGLHIHPLILIYSTFLLNYAFSSSVSYFISEYKLQYPSIINIIVNLLNTLAIYICVRLNLHLALILSAQAFFPILSAVIIYMRVSGKIRSAKINKRQILFCLNEIKYLGLAGIFTNIGFRINSAIVFIYLGANLSGLFNSAYKFIDMANPLISVLMMTLFPKINEIISGKEKDLSVNDLITGMLCIGTFTSLIIFSFPVILIKIVFGEPFLAASSALRILSVSFISIFTGNVIGFLIIAHRLQKQYLGSSAIVAVFNVSALSLVVPAFGIIGTAVVSVLTELLSLFILLVTLIRHGFLRLETKMIKGLALAALIMILSFVNQAAFASDLLSILLILAFITFTIKQKIFPIIKLQKIFYGKRIGYNTNI